MASLKSLGQDGMPSIFYQWYWPRIGGDIANVALFCLNSGKIISSLNHTFLTLIPKVKSLDKVFDFQPIALCNILYKLISKVLVNRLKKIMPLIIFESQSAFQVDKAILDNILVTFEILHHMKQRNPRKQAL